MMLMLMLYVLKDASRSLVPPLQQNRARVYVYNVCCMHVYVCCVCY